MENDIKMKEDKTQKEWIVPEATEIKDASSTESSIGSFSDGGLGSTS